MSPRTSLSQPPPDPGPPRQAHGESKPPARRSMRIVIAGLFLVFMASMVQHVQAQDNPPPPWWRPVYEPPQYLYNEEDASDLFTSIREGIDEARRYFGNYGRVYVYILGQQDPEVDSEGFHQRVIDQYTRLRNGGGDKQAAELIEKTVSGQGELYTSGVPIGVGDPPFAEIIYINPKGKGVGLSKGALHEYTHVFQKCFGFTPTWMVEGGATFFSSYLGEKRGWGTLRSMLSSAMAVVREVPDPFGIEQMEDIDNADDEAKKYYRDLGYQAGAWAVAFMIHESESQRIAELRTKYYPAASRLGWEAALAEYVDMEDKHEFYREFDAFLEQPLEEQLAILDTLKD